MLKIIYDKLIPWDGIINASGHQKINSSRGSAAAIVASSDSSAMAQPPFATLGEVVSRLTAGFSEVEEARRKITEAQARRYWVHSS
jgi:hypothetical protein